VTPCVSRCCSRLGRRASVRPLVGSWQELAGRVIGNFRQRVQSTGMVEWQRSEILALVGLLLTIVAVAAAIHTVPDERKRRTLGWLFAGVLLVAVILIVGPQLRSGDSTASAPMPTRVGSNDGRNSNLDRAPEPKPDVRIPAPSGTSEQVRTGRPAAAAACEGPITPLAPDSDLPLAKKDDSLAVVRTAPVGASVVISLGNCYRTVRTVVCDLDVLRVTAPSTLTFSGKASFIRVDGRQYGPPMFHLVGNLRVVGNNDTLVNGWSSHGVLKLAPCDSGRIKVAFSDLPRTTTAVDEIVLLAGIDPEPQVAISFAELAVAIDV